MSTRHMSASDASLSHWHRVETRTDSCLSTSTEPPGDLEMSIHDPNGQANATHCRERMITQCKMTSSEISHVAAAARDGTRDGAYCVDDSSRPTWQALCVATAPDSRSSGVSRGAETKARFTWDEALLRRGVVSSKRMRVALSHTADNDPRTPQRREHSSPRFPIHAGTPLPKTGTERAAGDDVHSRAQPSGND